MLVQEEFNYYFAVVHYSLSFLVSWTYSCDEVRQALYSSPKFVPWLKRLTLEAPEVCFVYFSMIFFLAILKVKMSAKKIFLSKIAVEFFNI